MTTIASTEAEQRKVDTIKLTINGRQVIVGRGDRKSVV
jgi:hypothetical protein